MIQKTILDYYLKVFEQYPTISQSDIKKILLYGLKSLYLHNSYGGDVLINRKGFWFYCGQLMKDSIKYFNYYKRKMRIKLRVIYKRKHILWDGYYYFALTLNQYSDYLKLKNKKGRPRKKFTFSKVFLYKIYDECSILESDKVAIFKVPYSADLGFTIYKEVFTTSTAELILEREPLKFEDILFSKYEYLFIKDYVRMYNKKEKNG